MIVLIGFASFIVGAGMLLASDKHHTEWKRHNPDAWVYPGTKNSWLGFVLFTAPICALVVILGTAS